MQAQLVRFDGTGLPVGAGDRIFKCLIVAATADDVFVLFAGVADVVRGKDSGARQPQKEFALLPPDAGIGIVQVEQAGVFRGEGEPGRRALDHGTEGQCVQERGHQCRQDLVIAHPRKSQFGVEAGAVQCDLHRRSAIVIALREARVDALAIGGCEQGLEMAFAELLLPVGCRYHDAAVATNQRHKVARSGEGRGQWVVCCLIAGFPNAHAGRCREVGGMCAAGLLTGFGLTA